MIESIFSSVSLNWIVLFLVIWSVKSFHTLWKIETHFLQEIELLKDKVSELTDEVASLKSSNEDLENQINQLDEELTPDSIKIKRLENAGLPSEIATEAVYFGAIGGHKIS